MGQEIERKFMLRELPVVDDLKVIRVNNYLIEQTYLAIGKEEEVRVRKSTGLSVDHVLTIKRGSGLVREEISVTLIESSYNQLLEGTSALPLKKFRDIFHIEGYEVLFEVDKYLNLGRPLFVVEVEFNSKEEADAFIAPTWFGEEVTEDKTFKNQALWESIQPASLQTANLLDSNEEPNPCCDVPNCNTSCVDWQMIHSLSEKE